MSRFRDRSNRVDVTLDEKELRRLAVLADEAGVTRQELLRRLIRAAWKERACELENDGEVFVEQTGERR